MALKWQFCGFRNAAQPHSSKISEEFLLHREIVFCLSVRTTERMHVLAFLLLKIMVRTAFYCSEAED